MILRKFNIDSFLRATACALVLILAFSVVRFEARCEGIRDSCLRLHIKANSDSNEDQVLKLKVRDAVLQVSEQIFADCNSEAEAFAAANQNIKLLNDTAQNVVYENGYSYPTTVSVGDAWFETRHYEDFTLPAGTYEAVRINIGDGEGENWWCVMFPALCIPSVSDNMGGMDEKEQEIVTEPDRYVVRFKVVEIFQSFKNKIGKFFGK